MHSVAKTLGEAAVQTVAAALSPSAEYSKFENVDLLSRGASKLTSLIFGISHRVRLCSRLVYRDFGGNSSRDSSHSRQIQTLLEQNGAVCLSIATWPFRSAESNHGLEPTIKLKQKKKKKKKKEEKNSNRIFDTHARTIFHVLSIDVCM